MTYGDTQVVYGTVQGPTYTMPKAIRISYQVPNRELVAVLYSGGVLSVTYYPLAG